MLRRALETLACVLAASAVLPAQVARWRDPGFDPGAEVVEMFGSKVPLDAKLVDEDGAEKTLGSYFDGKRPVVLNLGYYGCPALCGAVLNGLLDNLKQVTLDPGKDFEIVTVSINPLETPELAREKKKSYVKAYARPGAEAHWHFMTGAEAEVRKIADAVGFGYRYDASEKQYAHGAAVMFLAPDGAVMRYLFGIDYSPRSLRFAIVEAGRGTVGTVVDKILLNCYRYDPKARGYALAAMSVMQWGGALTVVLVAALILSHLRRERRQRQAGLVPAPVPT